MYNLPLLRNRYTEVSTRFFIAPYNFFYNIYNIDTEKMPCSLSFWKGVFSLIVFRQAKVFSTSKILQKSRMYYLALLSTVSVSTFFKYVTDYNKDINQTLQRFYENIATSSIIILIFFSFIYEGIFNKLSTVLMMGLSCVLFAKSLRDRNARGIGESVWNRYGDNHPSVAFAFLMERVLYVETSMLVSKTLIRFISDTILKDFTLGNTKSMRCIKSVIESSVTMLGFCGMLAPAFKSSEESCHKLLNITNDQVPIYNRQCVTNISALFLAGAIYSSVSIAIPKLPQLSCGASFRIMLIFAVLAYDLPDINHYAEQTDTEHRKKCNRPISNIN